MGESSFSLGLLLLTASTALAQVPDLARPPLLPTAALAPTDTSPTSPTLPKRIRLFRMQPGFVSELPWLDNDDRLPEPSNDSGPEWIGLAVGNDNPYFDLRRRGDPGGVGFARVDTQVQLFDTSTTSFALGLQAVTPRGLQAEGIADNQGPTVVTPALAVFHDLGDGTALQAFVGKHVPLMNRAAQSISRNVRYGMALQRSLSTDDEDPLSSLFVSVGALGELRTGDTDRGPMTWELLPGLHWKPAQTWWMSAGYVVPVGPTRTDTGGHWQLTCSWQY